MWACLSPTAAQRKIQKELRLLSAEQLIHLCVLWFAALLASGEVGLSTGPVLCHLGNSVEHMPNSKAVLQEILNKGFIHVYIHTYISPHVYSYPYTRTTPRK